jgi:hypothetical protein
MSPYPLYLPLDEPHLWEALRYTGLNPVRAGGLARRSLSPN